jgi:hypothetical protein
LESVIKIFCFFPLKWLLYISRTKEENVYCFLFCFCMCIIETCSSYILMCNRFLQQLMALHYFWMLWLKKKVGLGSWKHYSNPSSWLIPSKRFDLDLSLSIWCFWIRGINTYVSMLSRLWYKIKNISSNYNARHTKAKQC